MKHKRDILQRSAGVLLHITSLPGKYPIGDFGPGAYYFADFLHRAGQSYWQILPLNQVNASKAYSPYSPVSAFAGNILLISPELLVNEGLIKNFLKPKAVIKRNYVNFKYTEVLKQAMIDEAYYGFSGQKILPLIKEFEEFCESEKYWLDDYALYSTIRKQQGNRPWNEWPDDLKERKKIALDKFSSKNKANIECEKFSQFIFMHQWIRLKKYCNEMGIKIFGDIPIYIGYDSADVWSHPEYFKLRENKEMLMVAGCPPDYFDKNGQRWGMPVYSWDVLKGTNYRWWLERIRKNLQLFDLVRIDHFRGFSAFWEVPEENETARDGKWVKGPGKDLFDLFEKEFPSMPFIAEDLGVIDERVTELRDRYDLPGMRILMFAFGNDMPGSIHIPHNYSQNTVVYTGTHDNNTVKGWFIKELGIKARRKLSYYMGKPVNAINCPKILIQFAYKSVAKLVIIPMQDILALGQQARMNIPSVETGNWRWRLRKHQLTRKSERRLKKLSEITGRLI
jgi:4-alpha-glucanotransferase